MTFCFLLEFDGYNWTILPLGGIVSLLMGCTQCIFSAPTFYTISFYQKRQVCEMWILIYT